MYYTIFNTQFCEIILVGDEDGLSHLHLNTGEGKRKFQIAEEWIPNKDFFKDTVEEIQEYFKGQRQKFTIKLNPKGTDYQKKVWQELSQIPYGKVYTYKQVAANSGNEKASRAVGMANNKNPIPLIIPCHRVIGSNGQLVGFAPGIELKEKLINLEILMFLFNKLLGFYGRQNWWPADSPFEMMVGAILTQNTTWKNVMKALDNFEGKLSPEYIRDIPIEEIGQLIRSSGYYNQKAVRLKEFTNWYEGYNFDIDKVKMIDGEILRKELLEIKGVGRETADSILTYALEKPFFVVDTYTKRLFHRIGMNTPKTYDGVRKLVEDSIPKDLYLYNEFHALIVRHAKEFCFKTPECEGCPLYEGCKRKDI